MAANVPVPKIVYGGGPTTLTFDFPPRNIPYDVRQTVRHDNVASSGVRESIFEVTNIFLTVFVEYAKVSNIAAWDSFIQWAEQGNTFKYYPDNTVNSFTTYLLEDTNWTAAFKSLGMFTFSLNFRKTLGWP